MSVTSVLFDLDGTLVDPAGSITSGLRQALVANGLPDPGETRAETLVGPPLQVGLRTIDGVDDSNIDSIIEAYRLRYHSTGMDQARIYPGITELLSALRAAGVHVAVTTAKPVDVARELIARKQLDGYLDGIYGNAGEHAGMGSSKAHIVRQALDEGGLDRQHAVVVGDRFYDLDAARDNGLRFIGVDWGFAQPGELDAADSQAASAAELAQLLLGTRSAADLTLEGC